MRADAAMTRASAARHSSSPTAKRGAVDRADARQLQVLQQIENCVRLLQVLQQSLLTQTEKCAKLRDIRANDEGFWLGTADQHATHVFCRPKQKQHLPQLAQCELVKLVYRIASAIETQFRDVVRQ